MRNKAKYWARLLTGLSIILLTLLLTGQTKLANAILPPMCAYPAALSQSQSGDVDEAKRLIDQALKLSKEGRYADAIPITERVLAIQERALGPQHLIVANTLYNLAMLYTWMRPYTKVGPPLQRALSIYEGALGPKHPITINTRNKLGKFYMLERDYAKAETLYKRMLEIAEDVFGPEHHEVALVLGNLAEIYMEQGNYSEATTLVKRALAIREKMPNPENPDLALLLNNLGTIYFLNGEYNSVEKPLRRALAIQEKTLGHEHPHVAFTINNIAEFYRKKGDYTEAETLHEQARGIRERVLGPEHPDVADSLNNLAALYSLKGDYANAESLDRRALAIRQNAFGDEHPDTVLSMQNLATVYRQMKDYKQAEPLYERVLALEKKLLGPGHPEVAITIHNMGGLYREKGEYAKAEPFFNDALAIQEKALGLEHPDVAITLNSLGALYYNQGEYAKAEPFYRRALAIEEKVVGPEGPGIAAFLFNLAILYNVTGDKARALNTVMRADEVLEKNVILNLAAGSERQKLQYIATLSASTHWAISYNMLSAPDDPKATRYVLTTILRRKGRVLDTMAHSIAALRKELDEKGQHLLDEFVTACSQLASLELAGPSKSSPSTYIPKVASIRENMEKLEAEISRRTSKLRLQIQPVTPEDIQSALPQDAALVEFMLFYPFNTKERKWEAPHYAAYILGSRGNPSAIDLGEVRPINNAVESLRAALRKNGRAALSNIEREVKPLARALDEKIMRPVRKLLGQTRNIFLSPDGALNLIPFAALVDEKGKYLIENYSLNYLTAGRDLLRLQRPQAANKQDVTVFADPAFGGDITECEDRAWRARDETSTARKPINLADMLFCPLKGTAGESKALKAIFPKAILYTRAKATEAQLKKIGTPAILHIATHGFFLDDLIVTGEKDRDRIVTLRVTQSEEVAGPEFKIQDPLLKSGLAFAGANLHLVGDEDGILTAKEVSSLNLSSTKLVVLSACDTGIGDIKDGEGVYGLRRALVLAGAETQVISLWPVNDIATRDLMIAYYKELRVGKGRKEALRQVQLSMLRAKDRKHPYYWASFIQSGEWANLDGKR